MILIATASDFDFIYGLYIHPQVNPYLLYDPMDAVCHAVFDELLSKGIKYVLEENDVAIGMCKPDPWLL